jgi:cis-3-alkyl-4-acyloxetan-2-one decarboxylase
MGVEPKMNTTKPVDMAPFQGLYPFESNYLDRNGLQYHYIDEGEGEPVLMVHGNPTWSFYFRRLIQGLSPGYRTIAVDHMGCGLSDKPDPDQYDFRLSSRIDDLDALVNHLDLDRPITLVVHDWGGMIAMAWAVRHPERIARIVVTNTAAFHPPGKKGLPLRLWLIRYLAPFAVPAVLGLNLFARGALFMAPRKRMSRMVRAGLVAPYNSWHNRMATLKFVQDIPMVPGDPGFDIVRKTDTGLHKLANIPMLICWGKHDFVFDMDYFNEWRRRFPNAETHLFENAGHYLLEDEPEVVLATVNDFFNRHPTG